MGLIYATTNLINVSTLLSVSTEDPTFVKEYLYNVRPSLPFRFTQKSGNQIIVDLSASPPAVTLAAVFNHNLYAPTLFALYGGNANPPNTWHVDMTLTTNFNDNFAKLNQTYRYWMLDIDDATNPYNVEIGEFFLGQYSAFSSDVHLQPGRADGPEFFMARQETYYGQDWTAYLSENERFSISFENLNDPANVDELMVFLRAVQQTGGKFVFIPDDTKPWVYYVLITNLSNYANRLIYGTNELRQWRLELKTLTKGIALL